MINRKELKMLKSGEIDYIPLPDGYQLSINENNQVYISRGGKKHYYLSDNFLKSMSGHHRNINQIKLIIFIINSIGEIIKRLKKESTTRIKLEELIKQIREKIE